MEELNNRTEIQRYESASIGLITDQIGPRSWRPTAMWALSGRLPGVDLLDSLERDAPTQEEAAGEAFVAAQKEIEAQR